MRRILIAAMGCLLLSGCAPATDTTVITAGQQDPVAAGGARPTAATAPREAAASPDAPWRALDELCSRYCDQLLTAHHRDCPEPQDDVSLCADYLLEMRTATAAVDAAVSGMTFGVRDYGRLLDATDRALRGFDDFERRECHLVTAMSTAGDVSCSIQTMRLRASAAMVGLLLEEAAET